MRVAAPQQPGTPRLPTSPPNYPPMMMAHFSNAPGTPRSAGSATPAAAVPTTAALPSETRSHQLCGMLRRTEPVKQLFAWLEHCRLPVDVTESTPRPSHSGSVMRTSAPPTASTYTPTSASKRKLSRGPPHRTHPQAATGHPTRSSSSWKPCEYVESRQPATVPCRLGRGARRIFPGAA